MEAAPYDCTEPGVQTIAQYQEIVCDKLQQYGCPEKLLWLTECISILDFAGWHGSNLALDLGLKGYLGVVYFHESSNVMCHQGFNNDEEFEEACKHVAELMGDMSYY